MKTIDVLIVVDVVGALSSGNLSNNVYLVDTNKYLGSWNEGKCELYTKCYDGQKIKWRVTSISPDNDVNIVEFTGQIIKDKICEPQRIGFEGDYFWEGVVETQRSIGTYQYACTLSMDGKAMSFDPFLDVVKPE